MVTIHLLSGMHPVGIIFTLSVGQAPISPTTSLGFLSYT